MSKRFSKKYGNKGNRKLSQDAHAYQRLMLHQEQAAKTNMASMVRIQVFSIMHS